MCASMSTSALTNTTGMRTEVMHTRTVCSLPHGFSRDIDVWQGRSRPQSSSASLTHSRALSNKPYDSVYGGPKPPNDRVTLRRLMQKYRAGERISVVTAYDYPSAVAVDQSGIDVLLVGDRYVLGYSRIQAQRLPPLFECTTSTGNCATKYITSTLFAHTVHPHIAQY